LSCYAGCGGTGGASGDDSERGDDQQVVVDDERGDHDIEPEASGGDAGAETIPATELFSFFVTSLDGLQRLSGNDSGFGGDLSYGGQVGLAGADLICATLAQESAMEATSKTWRAFLSTSTEDAIDRVGDGPWHDRVGRVIATGVAGLQQERPDGDPVAVSDLPNEDGVPNSSPRGEKLTNHDTVTASDDHGRLFVAEPDEAGRGFSTCEDWTSTEPGQQPPVMGHSWPAQSGVSWVNVGRHASGCEALISVDGVSGDGATGIGFGGGYGGFYCFAQ
jgi:hypothetical protein